MQSPAFWMDLVGGITVIVVTVAVSYRVDGQRPDPAADRAAGILLIAWLCSLFLLALWNY